MASEHTVISNVNIKFSDGFIRQRRNLLLSSILLFIFIYTDASFSSHISILGITITAAEAGKFDIAPAILCLYFLIRYYQYLMQEEKPALRNIYIDFFKRLSKKKIQKVAERDAKQYFLKNEEYKVDQDGIIPFPYAHKYYQRQVLGKKPEYLKLKFYQRVLNYSFTPLLPLDDGAPGSSQDTGRQGQEGIIVGLQKFSLEHIQAIIRSITSTSYFTEYGLPYLVAFLSIGYFLFKESPYYLKICLMVIFIFSIYRIFLFFKTENQ